MTVRLATALVKGNKMNVTKNSREERKKRINIKNEEKKRKQAKKGIVISCINVCSTPQLLFAVKKTDAGKVHISMVECL